MFCIDTIVLYKLVWFARLFRSNLFCLHPLFYYLPMYYSVFCYFNLTIYSSAFYFLIVALSYLSYYVMYVFGMYRSSLVLHEALLKNVLKLPNSIFDVTPIGRILVRFSHDVDTVDMRLPHLFVTLMQMFYMVRLFELHQ